MALTVQDFMAVFSEAELREVELSTMGGETIWLRSLPYAKSWNFRYTSSQLTKARFDEISKGGYKSLDWDKNKLRASDYLIVEAMCNHDGSKFFKNQTQFKKWRNKVPAGVVNEILHHINEMNIFDDAVPDYDFLEDFKQKKK